MGMATLFFKIRGQLRTTTHLRFSRLREKSEKKTGRASGRREGTNGGAREGAREERERDRGTDGTERGKGAGMTRRHGEGWRVTASEKSQVMGCDGKSNAANANAHARANAGASQPSKGRDGEGKATPGKARQGKAIISQDPGYKPMHGSSTSS